MTPPAGRPEIGPAINIRLPDDLLADVDAYAKRFDISRAEVVRMAVKQFLVKQFLWDDEMTRIGNAKAT